MTPILADPSTRRSLIRDKAMKAISALFPIETKDYTVSLNRIWTEERNFSYADVKEAIFKKQTLQEPIYGDLTIRKNNKIVDRSNNYLLLLLPYYTPDGTFVVKGNVYIVRHMRRLKPGVYAVVKRNEELSAVFNLSKGRNFKIILEPESGLFYLTFGTTNIPIWPLLKSMGIDKLEFERTIPRQLAFANIQLGESRYSAYLGKLWQAVYYKQQLPEQTQQEKDIFEYFNNSTALDPTVVRETLDITDNSVTANLLLKAIKKILNIYNNKEEADDRDDLGFQEIHSVEDFINERIRLNSKELVNKIKTKINFGKNTIETAVSKGLFTKSVRSFITNSTLSEIPTQINPVEMFSHYGAITVVGEGGVSNLRAVPSEVRELHPSFLGAIDPMHTPESAKAGVVLHATPNLYKDDNKNPIIRVKNIRTNKEEGVTLSTLRTQPIAFYTDKKKNNYETLHKGQVQVMPSSQVKYMLTSPEAMLGFVTTLVPFVESEQGNRLTMSAKHLTQALPLKEPEAPLVQSGFHGSEVNSYEKMIAKQLLPYSPVDGTVKKITNDYIIIEPKTKHASKGDLKISIRSNFPYTSKTYFTHEPIVAEGSIVKANGILAESNFTKDKTLALGKNLLVAYVSYYGYNSNDAVVISEGASRKLTSVHMYREGIKKESKLTFNKDRFTHAFPKIYTDLQLNKLDERGIVKKGTILKKGDPIFLAMFSKEITHDESLLGKFNRSLMNKFSKQMTVWDKDFDGTVVELVETAYEVNVGIKTEEEARIGDKLSNRYGNKGVISKIIPDSQMLKDESGNTIDVLFTSAGVISRINPAQILETAVAKVAQKNGKPIVIPSFAHENNVTWVKDLLKKNSVKDKEILTDPDHSKKLVGMDKKGILVGPQYILKLFKTTDTNYSARGVEDYDSDMQPATGGEEGAKAIGRMEFEALLSHNARNILREATTLKGQQSDDFWRAYQMNISPPPTKDTFAFNKFLSMLQGSGIKVNKTNKKISLSPLTDNDIRKMSSGEVLNPRMVKAKNFEPESGGLFDTVVFGGLRGTKWGHINLSESIPNPIFTECASILLNMTKAKFLDEYKNKGGDYIKKQLDKLDINILEKEYKKIIQNSKGDKLDKAVKGLKYVQALKKENLTPSKAYMLSALPVLPPILRPVLPGIGTQDVIVGDANYLYRDVILAKDALSNSSKLPESDKVEARKHMYEATSALVGTSKPVSPQLEKKGTKGYLLTIGGVNSPKEGYVFRKLLRRKQDLSARGTAAPNPALGLNEIGIPKDMAWSLYEKFIIKEMTQQGYTIIDAKDEVRNKSVKAEEVLNRILKERPLLVNRAPTLHKFNIVSAYPVPIEGKTLQVNPFIEKGMNLDYDGDTIQLHVPVTPGAVREAEGMTLSNLIFGEQGKNQVALFPQHEVIIGINRATNPGKGDGKIHKYNTVYEAESAWKRGEVNLDDIVKLNDKRQA